MYFRLFVESIVFGFQALVVNKLRTFLSLLGVTIGIFAIVSVFTLVDSMERSIRGSIETLGDNVIFVQKWPWSFGDKEYAWWKYMMRPEVHPDELDEIKERSELSTAAAFILEFRRTLKFENSSIEESKIVAASEDAPNVRNFEIGLGRYFSDAEFKSGKPVCVIGARTAYDLFGMRNPVGKSIKVDGAKVTVIGVFEFEGQSLIGSSVDQETHIPLDFAKTFVKLDNRRLNPRIMVKARDDVPNQALIDELTGIMRSVRSLKPKQEQNFALNEISILSEGLTGFFDQISIIGMIIGGFSILVGGFSIANIMFVSVKERTNIIGIQKSLGAKNSFILFEFLSEAVMLTTIGGLIGMFLVFLISVGVSSFSEFTITLSPKNIITGIGISISIGLVSGLLPALSAAKLNPVDAIRAK
jgi:putative ABC transport system permease protein